MKKELTTHERMTRTFERRDIDRVVISDTPWEGTKKNWVRQGMPQGADWRDFFGTDKIESINADVSPRYKAEVLEETDRYVIRRSEYGVTTKNLKEEDSTPEFLDFTIKDSEIWKDAKARMTFDKSRVGLDYYKKAIEGWRADGRWVQYGFWFGFDITHSWTIGTETVLIAMMEEPEWMADIFGTMLDLNIKMFDYLWDNGVRADSIHWYDDMGYKNAQFFSEAVYCGVLKPFHKKAIDWAHGKGLRAELHSCGDIRPFIPHLIGMGLDSLNPIEVKAGMDPLFIKKTYGDKLVMHGGFNALLYNEHGKMLDEIDRLLPQLIKNGGYVFSSDHSIPNVVTADDFRAVVERVKKISAKTVR